MNFNSSDSEEFETPQFKQGSVTKELKDEQLKPIRFSFCVPPRSPSVSGAKITTSRPQSPFTMPKRSMSLIEFELDLPDVTFKKNKEIDPQEYRNKLEKLCPDVPQYAKDALEVLISGKNLVLVHEIELKIMLVLSAILQSNSSKHALVVLPSSYIMKWFRRFMSESSALWPEGKNEQQRAMSQIRNGRTQILISYPKGISSLELSMFDYVYVIKSELCTSCLSHFKGFKGQMIFHQTPGYSLNFPVECDTVYPHEKGQYTVPEIIEDDKDPLKNLSDVLERSADLTTIIISPFKNTMLEVVKRSKGKAAQYVSDKEPDTEKAYSSTTSCYYSPYVFEHYVFVGFPVTLDHFLSACLIGKKVTVLLSNERALKLQSLSHAIGVDQGAINDVLKQIFWNSKRYRKQGELGCFQISSIDMSQDSLDIILHKLVDMKTIELIPYESLTAHVKVLSIIDEMNISPLFNAILKGSANRNGMYTVNIQQLCASQNVLPMDMENELQKYVALKALTVKYEGTGTYVKVIGNINDEKFTSLQIRIGKEMLAHESEIHKSYNIAYTLMKETEAIGEFSENRKLFDSREVLEIPHEEVNRKLIEAFLAKHSNVIMSPLAVARILQGISSPQFTTSEWRRASEWGSMASCSFNDIVATVQKVIL